MRLHVFVLLLPFASWLFLTPVASAALPPVVAILANRDDPESLELARHYAKARGLADTAIIALPMPLTEEISWGEFIVSIWNPFLREAVRRDWLLATLGEEKDTLGRLRIVSSGHRLDALVICRGVPLRIAHDATRYDPASNPLTANPALRINTAAVDSELALLAIANPSVAAVYPNPLFQQDRPMSYVLEQIIPVGRLDGPTVDDAKSLVDRALVAERDGIAGRAYLDIGGPHRRGDEWIEACLPELQSLGFETDVDRAPTRFRPFSRFDAPVLYFGWYAGDMDGPFAAPDFRFPPGAIALHIHSFSAATLRSTTRGWTGPLVAKGVTATFGNVTEPYLEFTHQPHLLLRALARGERLGRAALYSVNTLSWQAILVGDPLYRPFAVSSEAQWARRKQLPFDTEAYARIRRMRLLSAAGRGADALALGTAGLAQNPTLPLALTLAGLQHSAGDAPGAVRTLGVFSALRKIRPTDRALALAAARAAEAAGDSKLAYKLASRLLAEPDLPPDFRLLALVAGSDFARTAGQTKDSAGWAIEYAKLTAPPPPPPSAPPAPSAVSVKP